MQSLQFNPSHSFQDLDMQMEVMHHFADQNPSFLETLNFENQQQQPLFQTTYALHGNNQIPFQTITAHASPEDASYHERKRRKVIEQSKSSSSNSDNRKKKILGKGKKEMESEEKMEEMEDFIHVRARRGQATDSHSLAERVRRAKINNKLKCLQNLVPGCHETMGMAGTLDEIINYVHSLQNQVEFLSMELAAASSCYGSNQKQEAIQKAQTPLQVSFNNLQECEMMQECKPDMDQVTGSHEMELFRDRFGELTCFRSSTWAI